MTTEMNTISCEKTNFMGGVSFKPFNPLKKAELIAFSSFLGEPTYYQPNSEIKTKKNVQSVILNNDFYKQYLIIHTENNATRNETFYHTINAALDFDFKKTLELAVRCRNEFLMRRSTAQILAIAACHPQRVKFNETNPKFFREILVKCWLLPTDAIACLDAWKALFGTKSKFPTFIKRAYEDRLKDLTPYQQEKYRKDSISMVRLCHASKNTLRANNTLTTLMCDGHLELDETDIKWEKHRSMGNLWLETLEKMNWRLPHMAAIRNVRGFAASNPGVGKMLCYLEMLLSGVKGGKQFPFRYITAYEQMKNSFQTKTSEINHEETIDNDDLEEGEIPETNLTGEKRKRGPIKVSQIYESIIMEYLEKCLQQSVENYPQLDGDIIAMCDNSGSARGTMTSTYGKQTVSNIGNLSGLLTAYRATGRGVVGVFGDDLKLYEVDKSRPLLEQYQEINNLGNQVGGNTENGVWLFFKRAFQNHSSYKFDHWFCYSDMQVGHGGLYGNDYAIQEQGFNCDVSSHCLLYIDIHKCINKYRSEINPKLNTYMVQTAGYDNTILPESTYRGAILAGWTGNEVVYAKNLCRLWDEIENI